jgi:hypothetical protein
VSLDLLDNILRLDFSLESAKGIFQRLSFLESDLSHSIDTSLLRENEFAFYNRQKLLNSPVNVKQESANSRALQEERRLAARPAICPVILG